MTKQITATVSIKFSWWVRPYLFALLVYHSVFGGEASEEKLQKVLKHGIKPVVKT